MQIEKDAENESVVKKSKKKKKQQKTKDIVGDDTNANDEETGNESEADNESEVDNEEMQTEENEEEKSIDNNNIEEEEMEATKQKKSKRKKKKGAKEPASIIQQIKNNVTKESNPVDSTLTSGIVGHKKKQNAKKNLKTESESDGMRFLRTDTDAITIDTSDKPIDMAAEDSDSEDDVINTQRMNIRDAFANDDVIEDFIAEKETDVEKSKPKEVDTVLPGWGDWGGAGLKVSARKRKRFTFVPVPEKKRLDEGKPNVIINEVRNKHFAKHQVILLFVLFKFFLF